jgi:serine/threonine protein phosphatase PrpC
VKKYITELVERRKQMFINDTELALIELFRDVNEALDDDVSLDVYLSGTTIVLALVSLTKITIANLGDCRAIIVKEVASSEFSYNCLTRDHTCMNEVEVERIRAAGARVEKTGSPPLPEDGKIVIYYALIFINNF